MTLKLRSAAAASGDTMVRYREALLITLVIVACKSAENPGGSGSPVADTVTGVWTGTEGPNLDRLTPTARLELTEDAGSVTGVLYSSNIFPDGGVWPVGSFTGTRDGGSLVLRDVSIPLPDGGLKEGFLFTGTFTPPNHLEGIEVRAKMDGGPLPVHYILDRTQ